MCFPAWQANQRVSKGKELLSVLVKGSHHFLHHQDGRSTVVPVHSGETIGPGLFGKILRDCDLNREQLKNSFRYSRLSPEVLTLQSGFDCMSFFFAG